MDIDYDYLFKIIVIGDSGIGKSSILLRFADHQYTDNMLSTIGVDFKILTKEYRGKKIKLQLWDVAGQNRFRTITTSYYRGVHGVIMVYNICDKQTFDNMDMWLEEVRKYRGDDCNKILIGNKSDKFNERQVDYNIGKDFAIRNDMPFIETSAKDNINIDQLFEILVGDIYDTIHKTYKGNKDKFKEQNITIDLTKDDNKTCCSIV